MGTASAGVATLIVRVDAPPPDSGDAFVRWVEPQLPTMARLARRLAGSEADDVVQDALEKAWRHRRRFDPSRGTAAAWLLTIVANEARRRRRSVTEPLLDAPVTDHVRVDVDLERAVRTLSARQRL
ncbi:MAG: polymerase, sigma-24 subunit, subfamily, partial [Frankiales bacterium]|nr:polymerase, sigma-24 subunit, subfamily [Frankiales bacterium]